MDDPRDALARLQPGGDGGGVGAVPLHPQGQGLDALQDLEGVEGRQGRPKVAQEDDPGPQDVGDRAQGLYSLGPDRAVVGGVRRVQEGLAFGPALPVELPGVDDQAADRGAVAAQVLGGRVDDDGRAMVEGPHQEGRRRIVHDQRDPVLPADGRDLGDREDLELRVRKGLRVVGARPVVGGPAEVLGVGGVDEAHLDPLVLQGVGEKVPGAAIEGGGGHHVVAGPGQVLQGEGRGRLAGGHREGADAAFQRRDALLQDVGRGVHDPGVDVAQLLQGEQRGGVAGVAELVGGRLVDRHRHRAGGGIRPPASVQDEGFGMLWGVGHRGLLARWTGRPS